MYVCTVEKSSLQPSIYCTVCGSEYLDRYSTVQYHILVVDK